MQYLGKYKANKFGKNTSTGFKITIPKLFWEKWEIENTEELEAYIDINGNLVFVPPKNKDFELPVTDTEKISEILTIVRQFKGKTPSTTKKSTTKGKTSLEDKIIKYEKEHSIQFSPKVRKYLIEEKSRSLESSMDFIYGGIQLTETKKWFGWNTVGIFRGKIHNKEGVYGDRSAFQRIVNDGLFHERIEEGTANTKEFSINSEYLETD